MTIRFASAVLALPLLVCGTLAHAEDTTDSETPIIASGVRADAHGPAGTMSDHVHEKGNLMVGLMWMHEKYGGTNRQGTSKVSPQQIADAGYTVRDSSMTMDMAMLHIMYAPSDRVTLMLVPSWMRMEMTMEGLPAEPMDHDHDHEAGPMAMAPGHSMLMPGQRMAHSVEGIGDTQFGALVSLATKPELSSHVGLMLSAPTGKVTRRNEAGNYVHYMMQGGSGTWDVTPSITVKGMGESFGWGAQLSYLLRMEDHNKVGFRFGNRLGATAWLSKPLGSHVSIAARVAYTDEGRIKGHYDGAHGHASPPDRQENYGGQRIETGLGLNALVGDRIRIGAEASIPVHQDLNGIQLPKKFSANLSASVMF
jgi:hypothetical protein